MKKTRVSQDESQFYWYSLSWSDTSSGCKSKQSRRSLSFSLRFTIRILTDTKASWKIWDVRQISARDKSCNGEFNKICTKSLLRVENSSIRILLEDDTLEYTSIDYMDHPIVAPRKRDQTSNPCIKDSRDSIGTVETRSRNIVEIRDDDFMIWKLMSSSPNSLSSKSFVSCPSKRNDRVQWEIIRSYDASFDEHDFELIIRIGDYYWVLSWVFQVNLMLTDRRRSLTDETHRTAVHILLT